MNIKYQNTNQKYMEMKIMKINYEDSKYNELYKFPGEACYIEAYASYENISVDEAFEKLQKDVQKWEFGMRSHEPKLMYKFFKKNYSIIKLKKKLNIYEAHRIYGDGIYATKIMHYQGEGGFDWDIHFLVIRDNVIYDSGFQTYDDNNVSYIIQKK